MLYVRVDILLTRGNHLHDRIISLRGEVLAHNPRLTVHKDAESRLIAES
jgi:hypothetical protein